MKKRQSINKGWGIMKKFINEFKKFALKGNMIDLAVGMIIGTAFNGIVSSLVNTIFMPILSLLTGRIDFSNLFVALDGNHYDTLAAAQEAGVACLQYGAFIQKVLEFIMMAFVVFLFVKMITKAREMEAKMEEKRHPKAPEEKKTKTCPFCKSEIAIDATRCPHCTSELPEEEESDEASEDAAAESAQ